MQTKTTEQRMPRSAPGTWSTDDYIRRWAHGKGMTRGECVVELQSLHDKWIARIDFDRDGQPVERIVAPRPRAF
ncbi:MAG TPA: hypothetical protein VEC01_01025 [Noviherbaspirillum sp.]|uniref:hypothetical protein n=1 Tax=Noviherbaspirillum sp. TaxID=1926288 RepID=UPI002D27A7FA|nr:hypothetical protein [Noviherbaspirillum sp.]HYD93876.1 hypothetical protein [Noviherbaspirillum sp.]